MSLSAARLDELVAALTARPGQEGVRGPLVELLTAGLGAQITDLKHEVRVVEARGRIDALLGRTVIELKTNLKTERRDAEEQLARYLPERRAATGEAYVGLTTDGLEWSAYEMRGETLVRLRDYKTDLKRPTDLLAWLDGAIATREEVIPDAINIRAELGQESVAFMRAEAELRTAWAAVADHPTASLQRQLWSQLLTLVYGKNVESDTLWIQHTFLVVTAKTIAARIMELDTEQPEAVLSGRRFAEAGVFGAVESDFFDWVLLAPDGGDLVRRIARHVARFNLREVKADLMKVLYESLIDRDQRHGLGEYYTPDWLAAKVVRHAVSAPLEQTVLDPACGSGTFLFHAIRHLLEEAADAGLEPEHQPAEAARLIAGMDIHPVAVIIARVTYLLALAPVLGERKGSLSIPVYLGDALQLSVRSYMQQTELVITVPPPPGEAERAVVNGGATGGAPTSGAAVLTFPERLARDGPLFDKLIEDVRAASLAGESHAQFRRRGVRTIEQHYKRDLIREEEAALDDLTKTYLVYDDLRKAGRDTIWGYVARNLTRPFTFSADAQRVNVLIGNPPWVAFRHMSEGLQKRFRELSRAERIYVGGKLATQNDLAALFTVRAAGLYLKPSGRIAFVLPMAVMTRGQYARFRTGSYETARIAWDEAWVMDSDLSPVFPVPSCVLFGRRRAVGKATPERVRKYVGRLPLRDAPEAMADDKLAVQESAVAPAHAQVDAEQRRSDFQAMFRQGATLVPRMLCLVERKSAGRLGSSASRPLVESRRTTLEKRPWKNLPAVSEAVEAEFLRPVYLGESILPFRAWRPFEGVIPANGGDHLLSAEGATNEGWSGLAGWMRKAEALWTEQADSALSLVGRWNFHNELGSQFPIRPLRVVYAKAGMQPAACLIRDDRAVVDHKLYWAEPESEDEGYFLLAILNSEAARARVAHLQSRGQFGARDFDKVTFTLPIPRFSEREALHRDLAAAAREAEVLVAGMGDFVSVPFQRARAQVRTALKANGLAGRIDALVERLLG